MEKTLSLGDFEELSENEIIETEGGAVSYNGGSTHGGCGTGGSRDKSDKKIDWKSELSTFFDIFISVDPYSPGGPHYNPYRNEPFYVPNMT